jgi:dGTPase
MGINLVRERLLGQESRLSVHAARTLGSQGRRVPEPDDPLRTAFQLDRDRILNTKSFRRLKHKTQVFIAPLQDHYVTRLTHTLEVAQVARTIARALNLNEDLAEAAALGHDIGHGPFGHAGEEALADCLPDGFRHNLQSVRVLDVLENGGQGLNLTVETLDAIRAGIIGEDDLPEAAQYTLGRSYRQRVDALIADIVDASWAATGQDGSPAPFIQFSPRVHTVANELREFMFQRVYLWDSTRIEAERGIRVVKFLFDHFVRNPGGISPDFSQPYDPVERRAADYVSGMTDRFAIRLARSLGCPDATRDLA